MLRAGFLDAAAADARADSLASARRFASAPCAFRASISLLELPSNVTLSLGESSGRTSSSLFSGKGGFSNPGLGAIRNFWFSMGTLREEEAAEARSWIVAESGRVSE